MKKQVVIFAFCALCCRLFVLYSDPALEAARQGFYLWRDAVLPALLPFYLRPYRCKTAGAISMQNPLVPLFHLHGFRRPHRRPVSRLPGGRPYPRRGRPERRKPHVHCRQLCRQHHRSSPAGLAHPDRSVGLRWGFFPAGQARRRPSLAQAQPAFLFPPAPGSHGGRGCGHAQHWRGHAVFHGLHGPAPGNRTSILAHCAPCPTSGQGFPTETAPQPVAHRHVGNGGRLQGQETGLSLRQTAALAAFFFSFGGICILVQSLAFARIRLGQYLGRKLLQGCLSALLAYFLCPLFLPDAQAVFAPASSGLAQNAFSALWVGGVSLLAASCLLLLSAWLGRIKDKLQRENCA